MAEFPPRRHGLRAIFLKDGSSISQTRIPLALKDHLSHIHSRDENGNPISYCHFNHRFVGETTVLFCSDCGLRLVIPGSHGYDDIDAISKYLVEQGVALGCN